MDKISNLSKIIAFQDMIIYCTEQIIKLKAENERLDKEEQSHVEN